MARGGKRPGAGAPKGNLNALKHGRRSAQFAMLGALLAADPSVRQALLGLAERHQLKRRRANEVAAELLVDLIEHARSIAEGKPSRGPFENLLRMNVQSPVEDRRTIADIARLAVRADEAHTRKFRKRPQNDQNPRTNAPQNQNPNTKQAPKPND